jgi:F-type H+-transporting ATPase subunit c
MKFRLIRLLSVALMMMSLAATALAQGDGTTAGGSAMKLGAFAVAIAAFGGALGQGKAVAAACEGTARNPGAGPRLFTMMILGLALIETLALLTFATVVTGN